MTVQIYDVNNLTKALEVMHRYVEPQYTRAREELKAYRTCKSDLGFLGNRIADCFSDEFKAALVKERERVIKQEEILAIECDDLQKAFTAILDAEVNKKTVHNTNINQMLKECGIKVRINKLTSEGLWLNDLNTNAVTLIKYSPLTFEMRLSKYLKPFIQDDEDRKCVVEQLFQYTYERIDRKDIFKEKETEVQDNG